MTLFNLKRYINIDKYESIKVSKKNKKKQLKSLDLAAFLVHIQYNISIPNAILIGILTYILYQFVYNSEFSTSLKQRLSLRYRYIIVTDID